MQRLVVEVCVISRELTEGKMGKLESEGSEGVSGLEGLRSEKAHY